MPYYLICETSQADIHKINKSYSSVGVLEQTDTGIFLAVVEQLPCSFQNRDIDSKDTVPYPYLRYTLNKGGYHADKRKSIIALCLKLANPNS